MGETITARKPSTTSVADDRCCISEDRAVAAPSTAIKRKIPSPRGYILTKTIALSGRRACASNRRAMGMTPYRAARAGIRDKCTKLKNYVVSNLLKIFARMSSRRLVLHERSLIQAWRLNALSGLSTDKPPRIER